MRASFYSLVIAAAVVLLAGCAVVPPKEIPQSHDNPIVMEEKVGSSLDEMKYHCAMSAHQMAIGAALTDINYRVLMTGARTIVEVDAVVHMGGAGFLGASIPATMHCEYQGGRYADLHWTRGLSR